MSLHLALFALDVAAIVTNVLLAAVLLKSWPRHAGAWLAAAIALNSAGFNLFQRAMFGDWIPAPFQIGLPPSLLLALQVSMNTTPGLFMLLSFVLFQERRFPRVLMLLFALQVALEDFIPFAFGITTHPSQGPTDTDTGLWLWSVFEALPALLQVMFVVIALYWTVRDLRVDLVPARRLLRALVLLMVGCMLGFSIATRLLVAASDLTQVSMHGWIVALSTLLNLGLLLTFSRIPSAPAEALPSFIGNALQGAPTDASTATQDYRAFIDAMAAGAYREPGLTIAALAVRLHLPEYRLRRLIHERLGDRNFNAMLHRYRIAQACAALADPAQRELPILTIALSLGYQSINPFNRAFKELMSSTPSTWRQQALARAQPTPRDLDSHTDS